jgi:SAM-dependent methyltransferase
MLVAALTSANAQLAPAAKTDAGAFTPYSGQAGKDVIWVPSPQALVDRMLEMAGATPADYLIDLGSGDGRTVITAAKRGIRALGVEYNADMVALSTRAAAQAGVADKATFVQGDIFETDFSQATVLTLFLLPELNLRLRPTILNMKPGTRVVSNSFTMGDWMADESAEPGGDCTSYCKAYKWVVPAKVQGTWRLPNGELRLTQRYQTVTGTLSRGGTEIPISEGRLNGAELTFVAGDTRFNGTVNGTRIEATAQDGSKQTWTGVLSDR